MKTFFIGMLIVIVGTILLDFISGFLSGLLDVDITIEFYEVVALIVFWNWLDKYMN